MFEAYYHLYKATLFDPMRPPLIKAKHLDTTKHKLESVSYLVTQQENASSPTICVNHSCNASNSIDILASNLVDQKTSSLSANVEAHQYGAHEELYSNNEDIRIINEPGDKVVRLGEFNSLELGDIVNLATVFIVLLLAKRLLTLKLASFKRIEQLGLRPKDRERLDECIWRLIYYSFSSTLLIYCCFKHNLHHVFTKNPTNNGELSYFFEIDWSSYVICMIEAGFYMHATYALVFEDVWRRDSPMMLVHHLAAVFATLTIYATR